MRGSGMRVLGERVLGMRLLGMRNSTRAHVGARLGRE